MSTLVTGGAGYIGSHMSWHLLDAGEEVVVLDDLSTGWEWMIPKDAHFVRGDSGDRALVSRAIREYGIDSIIHCAGSWSVAESVSAPLSYYSNNTVAAHALISAAIEGNVPYFVFSSTAAVYGTGGLEPVSEDAVKAPQSPYGRSKLMIEEMLADAANAHNLRFSALRYFNVAGADPLGRAGEATRNSTHLVKIASETAVGLRPSMAIYGTDYPTPDGTCVRDYIHVTDLVDIHALALAHLKSGGGDFVANCGYGRGFSVRQVIDTVQRISGRSFPVTEAPRRPGDPAAIIAATDLLKERLGWRPKYDDLDVIISGALAWEEKLSQIRKLNRVVVN